ncbi:MAG TPA: GtrA family protein [Allosphingosinicella sp.]|nr:GtrA family protein [Allosphingosinicella sp.]
MIQRLFCWRPTRYVIVGGVCAIVHNSIMILGDIVGIHYLLMNFVSFSVVTPAGYLLHSGFTFGTQHSWPGFMRFASGVAVGFPISLLTMALLCTGFEVPVVIAAPVATIVLFLWNYASAHWAILGRFRFRA